MQMCSRCHKRPAVVFITKLEAGKNTTEGLCLQCANELGIKPVQGMLEKMGISEDDMNRMSEEMEGLAEMQDNPDELPENTEGENSEDNSRAPALDFSKIFGAFPFGGNQRQNNEGDKGGKTQNADAPKQPRKPLKRKFIDNYCTDLTKKAREGKLDGIVGRERELARVIQILLRRQKNNPCLIGEPGVGKTALAEALAEKIAAGDVPYKLLNKEVQLVDMTAIVAGTQFRGQFEARMKGLIEEVKTAGNIILVIDEVHTIAGTGDAEGGMNASNILKPALSKGEIQLIGATTLTEYRKYIEKDSALERRFQPVMVDEPSIDDSIEILNGIKGYYESYHGIKISADIVRSAVMMSERYISDRFLPDKAIDLLDEASSYVSLHSDSINRYRLLSDKLAECTKKREELEGTSFNSENSAETEAHFKAIADKKTEELNLARQCDEAKHESENVQLTVNDLAKVIEIWTSIPATSITENEFIRLDRLSDRLKSRIVGQDKAVDAVVRAIKRSRAGVSYKRKPVSFIFAGPTGVGKTELVKTLAAELFNTPESLIRLDMSEFMEKYSVSRIIGSPPGYVGYDDAGQLTEKIRRKPYTVVLFDEIEKAHPDVMNILLQILDDGRVTDAHGKVVNFENTVIIMTTNAGSNTTTGMAGFGESIQSATEDRTMKALNDFLRPEFINRVDEVITFNSLTEDNFTSIASIMLSDLSKALSEKGITVTYSEQALQHIARKSYSVKFGARNMRRLIQSEIEDVIASEIISRYGEKLTAIDIGCSEDKLTFNYL